MEEWNYRGHLDPAGIQETPSRRPKDLPRNRLINSRLPGRRSLNGLVRVKARSLIVASTRTNLPLYYRYATNKESRQMKKLLTALAFLLLCASPAHATLLIFNEQWIGTYDIQQQTFSVTIGDCGDCTYNIPDINFADPLGTATIHGMIITPGHEGRLDYFAYNRTWFTLNYDDSQLQRLGTYRLYEVSEPPAWLLLGVMGITMARIVIPR